MNDNEDDNADDHDDVVVGVPVRARGGLEVDERDPGHHLPGNLCKV